MTTGDALRLRDTMEAVLTSLPTEILADICTALATPPSWQGDEPEVAEGMTALLQLGRTCRLLHAVVCPVLYQKATTQWTGKSRRILRLAPLVRTLAENPALAQHVREIEVVEEREYLKDGYRFEGHDLVRQLHDDKATPFESLIATSNLLPAVEKRRKEGSPVTDVLAVLLLCITPRAHTARFAIVHGWNTLFLRTMNKDSSAGPLEPAVCFPNLTSLTIAVISYAIHSLDSVVLLLKAAPNLADLSLSKFEGGNYFHTTQLNRLKSVVLTSCLFSYGHYECLFGHSRVVERFTSIDDSRHPLAGSSYAQAYACQILRALKYSASSLRQLEVDLSFSDDSIWAALAAENQPPAETLITRARFPALEELALNYNAIEAVEDTCLVSLIAECPALRRLVLREINRQRFDELKRRAQQLAREAARKRFPSLRRVDLYFQRICTMIGSPERTSVDALERQFALADVELVIHTKHPAPASNRRRPAHQFHARPLTNRDPS